MLVHKVESKSSFVLEGNIAKRVRTVTWPTPLNEMFIHVTPQMMISSPRFEPPSSGGCHVAQAERAKRRTNKGVDIDDGPANLGCDWLEMRLAMLFPTVSNDPLEAFMTVMNVRLELLELARHFSANACLNVLASLGFGETAFVRSMLKSIGCTKTHLFNSEESWEPIFLLSTQQDIIIFLEL
jgi:hypothetical protein